ncbi:HlyD family efflux transporter periplasmic adaptor subunit [Desulforhopalus vacuolatus]|uniref:efflux RND transporter periplasmic adaptor subunit n=1 Tax=Desulforhopalus vacuolatus TaxID=40414 RepID=UPI00196594DC|nr:HlyD family efflux transporter periplasmic adaptor subunit [Desulforhopalus vacuolatus]MBM9519859.1 HlyD family efflux transporter periplasmic adaptor subunit [Desulforhopalus vacuolatus]
MTQTAEAAQIAGLNILVQLSRRVREAGSPEEIGFIAVNESKQLLVYRQSALWIRGKGIVNVSGVPDPDRTSPFLQWLNQCCKKWQNLNSNSFKTPEDLPEQLSRAWIEWVPLHAAVIPLKTQNNEPLGILIFFREEPWQENEQALISELSSIYAHGFALHYRQNSLWMRMKKHVLSTSVKVLFAIALLAALFYPVRMSVQAPAEVVPKDPFVVRSPLDTVIDKFHVKPNQNVEEGQLLFEFDRIGLAAQHDMAAKAYQIASEEYRQISTIALVDDTFRAGIATRRGKMEEKAMELDYSLELLGKTEVRAPRSGIVVFAEESDWIGKNVSVGERVLTIADPEQVEILIQLPVADAIGFVLKNTVKLYLSSSPQTPLDGTLRYVSYTPEVTALGITAYRLKADFTNTSQLPRIGMTGTARIYGKQVSLGYYLFRRPLTALRQRLGW